MQRNQVSKRTQNLTITGLLTAIGIFIPLIMPFKVVIGPASFTLGSHVPVDMSMFRKPSTAAIVAVGTTIGFLMAVSNHMWLVLYPPNFATIGLLLQKHQIPSKTSSELPLTALSAPSMDLRSGMYIFDYGSVVPPSDGFMYTLIVLIGIGTLIHGMIDFKLPIKLQRPSKKEHTLVLLR